MFGNINNSARLESTLVLIFDYFFCYHFIICGFCYVCIYIYSFLLNVFSLSGCQLFLIDLELSGISQRTDEHRSFQDL